MREKLVYPALAGGLYAALTMILAPLSYGPLQFRVAEALCVLPFFCPNAAVGLAIGCAVANTISSAGILDIVFGALSTLLAGAFTAAFGKTYRRTGQLPSMKIRFFACLMPVLFNALIVGAVLARVLTPGAFWQGFAVNAGEVALGEAGVMFLLGLPLMNVFRRIFASNGQNP